MNIMIPVEQAINKPNEISENDQNRIFNPSLTIKYKDQNEKGLEEKKKVYYSFFLFVNPTSGGNKASAFTKLDTERIKFFSSLNPNEKAMPTYETEIFIYNLKDNEKRKKGFETLKEEQENGKSTIRVIVGGGDGTVMWVVEEMIKYSIDVEKCPIGIVPFGTGNDFSRVLGWGGSAPSKLIGINLDSLKSLINKWRNAITEEFDIWDINFETFEDGCFKHIIKRDGKAVKEILTVIDENQKNVNLQSMNKRMSNYFSIGIDARIGLGFDRHRSNNACCNKVVYCCEGFKKFFLKTQKMRNVLDSLEVLHEQDVQSQEYSHMEINIEGLNNQVIFDTKVIANSQNGESSVRPPHLKGNPACLLCLNINSYMGGASDVWQASRGKIGVINAENEPLKDFGRQNFGDGKLEFLSFSSSMSLAQERFFKGRADRVGQGSGPFLLKFRNVEKNQQPVITYFQIDGEFYQVISPKSVKINLSKALPRGKIKVLLDISSVQSKN